MTIFLEFNSTEHKETFCFISKIIIANLEEIA